MFEQIVQKSVTSTGEESMPVATFNNSLKEWQARWQAQRTAAPAEAASVEAAPAPRLFKIRPCRAKRIARSR